MFNLLFRIGSLKQLLIILSVLKIEFIEYLKSEVKTNDLKICHETIPIHFLACFSICIRLR